MDWKIAETIVPEPLQPTPTSELLPADVFWQLESITTSNLFSKSKRYPNFLRYIVEHAMAGRAELLKERTLGVEVFHRPTDYDTNADPVVRITAGEIRKRLAQYYQAPGHEHELRIDLPLGSYAPLFFKPGHETPSLQEGIDPPTPQIRPLLDPALQADDRAASVETASDRRPDAEPLAVPVAAARTRPTNVRAFLVALMLLAACLGAGFAVRLAWARAQERGIASFWNPLLHAENPALIVVGVHSANGDGRDRASTSAETETEKQSMLAAMTTRNMIPVSDVASYSHITDLLVHHDHPYRVQGAADTTFSQLQPGPVILIGGLDNAWTLRLTAPLRFHFSAPTASDDAIGGIEDGQQPGTRWRFSNAQSAHSNSQDYALVASFFDPGIEQRVLIAAGIGMSGTAAAASFLTNNRYLQAWRSQNSYPTGRNVELVLSTEIVDGQQGPPRVVASYVW